jgi:aquacobalamin reductase/NAD(P)H-flavin reductase
MVVMGKDDHRPFSIASSPCRHSGELELHIGAAEENAYASEVVDKMTDALNQGSSIDIDAPHGDAWLRNNSRPILLIAGGTGFSYVRSILDHCVSQKISNQIHLYWGARTVSQLYAIDEMEKIARQHNNITFIPVVESAHKPWHGRIGNVLDGVKQDFDSLADVDIYIAGRFEMAGAAREQFCLEKNAKQENMFADAYAFI